MIVGLLCAGLFPATSLAEDEFEAREGVCWNLTADGVLTIDNNWGWLDFQRDGFIERANILVIGKDLTDFLAFNDDPQEAEESNHFYPNFEPKQIEVEEGNPVFHVEEGLLINTEKKEIVLAETRLKKLVIPEGIQTINAFAFYQRPIESIQFPTTLKTIENDAFYACEHLTKIQFSDGLQSIGDNAFYRCQIRELTLPDSVTKIGDFAFCGCDRLKTVRLPAQTKEIPYGMFKNCTNLSKIDLPEGLESIGRAAFRDCINLNELQMPETLREIGAVAFDGCKFKLLVFPKALTIDTPTGDDAYIYSTFEYIGTAVFPGDDYHFGSDSFDEIKNMIFLSNCPEDIPKDSVSYYNPKVYYLEENAESWQVSFDILNGWDTTEIERSVADQMIEEAVSPSPEPTSRPPRVYVGLGESLKTGQPGAGLDSLVFVFIGLLALIATGTVILAVKTTKKKHKTHVKKG